VISTRYLAPVCALLALACVPTVIHSYIGATESDGLTAAAVDTTLAGRAFSRSGRYAAWGREVYNAHDWIERIHRSQSGGSVRLFVARSYDLKKLYHHPELAVLHGTDLRPGGIARLRIGTDDLPVHLLDGPKGRGVAAYALLYDDRFVENPVQFQLRTSLALLVSRRKAMTIFLAYDDSTAASDPFEQSAVAQVLSQAIASFRSQMPAATSRDRQER
jgi:hypothetical protein